MIFQINLDSFLCCRFQCILHSLFSSMTTFAFSLSQLSVLGFLMPARKNKLCQFHCVILIRFCRAADSAWAQDDFIYKNDFIYEMIFITRIRASLIFVMEIISKIQKTFYAAKNSVIIKLSYWKNSWNYLQLFHILLRS